MSNSEIINDFVDGTLGHDREDELFQVLSTSQSARNELKELMAIKSAVHSDSEAFIPSPKSTMAIFGALGFQAPMSAPAPISNLVKFKSFISKYAQALTGGVIASGLTATLIFTLFNPFDNVNNNVSKEQYIAQNKVVSKTSVPTSLASVETSIATKNTSSINNASSSNGKSKTNGIVNESSNTTNTKVIVKYVYVPVEKKSVSNDKLASNNDFQANNSNVDSAPVESNTQIPSATITPATMAMQSTFANNGKIGSGTPLPIIPIINSILGNNGEMLGLRMEIGGAQYFFAYNDKINPANRQSLNNSNIALMYDLSDEIALGLDYRRESFYQKYDGTEITSKGVAQVRYEQEPNFQTLALNLRYSPDFARFSIFSPYTQIAAGLNNAGVVGRLMLGTDMYVYSNYYISVGYDYSTLRYTHQSNWFNTNKTGLHIGAGLKF